MAEALAAHEEVVEENRRLYNQVLDLKGNIRVFCRLRPLGTTGDPSEGGAGPAFPSPPLRVIQPLHAAHLVVAASGSPTSTRLCWVDCCCMAG